MHDKKLKKNFQNKNYETFLRMMNEKGMVVISIEILRTMRHFAGSLGSESVIAPVTKGARNPAIDPNPLLNPYTVP